MLPALEVRRSPLPRDEQSALAVRAREGDQAAAARLVKHSVGFVRMRVYKLGRGAIGLFGDELAEDLFQEGMRGLLKATQKFDPDRGIHFLTYADQWVRAYIGECIKKQTPAHFPGAHVAQSEFLARDGIVDPVVANARRPALSLNTLVGDEGETEFIDRLQSPEPSPEDATLAAVDAQVASLELHRWLGVLDRRERIIVRRRFLGAVHEQLDEIGKDLGLSRERVRQIEKVAVRKILRVAGRPWSGTAVRDFLDRWGDLPGGPEFVRNMPQTKTTENKRRRRQERRMRMAG